ncbi:hypothetical protein KR222_000602 [Zaprionus bogoriensis]|nr:hypothetical protein KR222_000602 [Zaprionus bogoriensis]
MSLDKIPEADMFSVSKSSQAQRRAVLGFVPQIGLPIVDYEDVARIDAFYLECQKFRDYYRDPYDKVHKPEKFQHHMGRCGVKVDTSVEELRRPIRWVVKRQPVIFPVTYPSQLNLGVDMGEVLKGRYGKTTCIRYKR